MKMCRALIFLAAAALGNASPALAQHHRGEQDEAYQGRRLGALLPLRAIEGQVVPGMKRRGAAYIGAELDSAMARYRLKFLRAGDVIWVDVDGRTGQVVGRAGE